ncbi:hypothetical protein M433DRAFT_152186 [Acidomyces richmondensis BFW]|nr:MAG: hypothetical protein FE78DRAFT_86913 [Acidomyces sp. 'richmondensis']KYG47495.1 hypothetical protein M433DRAFT_152186 [Acidomyces richmondensis BFW]
MSLPHHVGLLPTSILTCRSQLVNGANSLLEPSQYIHFISRPCLFYHVKAISLPSTRQGWHFIYLKRAKFPYEGI